MVKKKSNVPSTEWYVIPFGDCLSTLGNNTLPRAALNYDEGKIRNIHYGDVLIKFPSVLDVQREKLPYINSDVAYSIRSSFLHEGDVVIADTAEDETVGKATEISNLQDEVIVAGLHTIPCRPKSSKMFASKYLGYYINHSSFHDQIVPYITGIKVSSISKSSLEYAYVSVPPIDEQERIVEILSDIDELILNLEKLIAKKTAIKQGVMQKLFSFESDGATLEAEYKIGEMGDFYSGLSGKSKRDFGHGKGRYITFLNVLENTIIDTSILESVDIKDDEFQNRVHVGDLLFNTSSETPNEVAMCAVYLNEDEEPYLNSFCFGFRLKKEIQIDPLYFAYFFNSRQGREIMTVLAQGATRYNLSKANFEEVRISLPSYHDQVEVAQILSDMDKELEMMFLKYEKYKAIKVGMMNELLTGRTRLI